MINKALLAAAILLTGCHGDSSPHGRPDQSAQARRDSDAVKEINRGPMIPIEPQPILEREIKRLQFRSGGCVFSPGNGGHGAIALAMEQAGYMKFDNRIVRFAADSGSALQADGSRARYVGATHLFRLQQDGKGGGHLTVEDPGEHVVYDEDGKVWCNG